tara:strand:- start:253 stop:636 length:384 start_codon:yes stop_codon:yes gene_type:complete
MKVKISKTIDIGQIPTEARRMLDQAKNHLVYGLPESMNQITRNSLSSNGEEFFKAIETIELFRQELAVLDESMQEVQNILKGYKEAIMPEVEPPVVEHSEEEYEEEEADQVSDIEEVYEYGNQYEEG